MKKILVPVDFSSHTEISCRYALGMATATDVTIILFHSFFDQVYFSDGGFSTGFESGVILTDEIIFNFYKQKEARLSDLAHNLKEFANEKGKSGIIVESMIESGDPEVQILNAIDNLQPDLIVMGSSGMGKKRFLSGSVAKRIIDHTSRPVMAIPAIKEFLGVDEILYMTSFDPSDAEVILKLFKLFEGININIHCLHLNINDSSEDAYTKMKELSLNTALQKLSDRTTFSVIPCTDSKGCLEGFIQGHEIRLIAFIPHKRNIFRNLIHQEITKEELFLTNIPILAVSP